jgi:hypothetical protein
MGLFLNSLTRIINRSKIPKITLSDFCRFRGHVIKAVNQHAMSKMIRRIPPQAGSAACPGLTVVAFIRATIINRIMADPRARR